MIQKLKSSLGFIKNSYKDCSTNRKIVVIESDDWGSIRMPSKEAFNELKNHGFPLSERPFERFDSLLTNEDLEKLYGVLKKYRDLKHRRPVITINTIMANPDFNKIQNSAFTEYFYESFLNTLKNYKDISFATWQKGIDEGLLFPQLHGREHLNVETWMNALQDSASPERFAFHFGLMGIPHIDNPGLGNQHQIAFNNCSDVSLSNVQNSISEAARYFENTFGFQSKSFIAPAYTWNKDIEDSLNKNNIKYLQGGRYQILPMQNGKIKHYIGEKSKINGLTYMVRNAFFEPSTTIDLENRQTHLDALKLKTKLAFQYSKPLIISMHRLNFCGRICKQNREVNLDLLDNYLMWLTRHFKDVEFLNTVEFGQIIK